MKAGLSNIKKPTFLALMAFLLPASAFAAAPWPNADCALTSAADLQGTSLVVGHGQASTQSERLGFSPQSAFVATGYALKLFSNENFNGTGLLFDGEFSGTKTDGGTYINVKDLGQAIASFACVQAGVRYPYNGDYTRTAYLQYYNNKVFTLDGYRGNHPTDFKVTLTYLDGRKLLTASSLTNYGKSNEFTWDLESGALTVTHNYSGTYWSKTYLPARADQPDAFMQYLGAASLMKDIVASVAANKDSARDVTVPNLELRGVVARLGDVVQMP